jgi:hypothetical protein
MKVNSAILTVELVDESTGELTSKEYDVTALVAAKVGVKKTSTAKKANTSKVVEEATPILRLEENKYALTSGAIEALGAVPGESHIDIKFQKINDKRVPVIGLDEVFKTKGGNKLAKAGTVSYRGKNNESLSKYGSEFTLEAHPSVEGLFILKGNKNPEVETEEVEAEVIAVPEVEDEENLLDDLTADVDATEINADDFDYTL